MTNPSISSVRFIAFNPFGVRMLCTCHGLLPPSSPARTASAAAPGSAHTRGSTRAAGASRAAAAPTKSAAGAGLRDTAVAHFVPTAPPPPRSMVPADGELPRLPPRSPPAAPPPRSRFPPMASPRDCRRDLHYPLRYDCRPPRRDCRHDPWFLLKHRGCRRHSRGNCHPVPCRRICWPCCGRHRVRRRDAADCAARNCRLER